MALSRRARIVLVIAAVVVVGLVVLRWQWNPIRVRLILSGSDADQVKIEAIHKMGNSAVPSLIGIFEGSGGSWKEKELVGRILVHEPFRRVAVLERALAGERVQSARVAAYLLVDTRNADRPDDIFEVCRSWFDDRAFEHRGHLTHTLARLGQSEDGRGDPRCVELIGKVLAGGADEDEPARQGAADALGAAFRLNPEGLAPLVEAARGDPSDRVRARALRSLGMRGWTRDMTLYERGLTFEDHTDRMLLARGLAGLGKAGEPLLGRLLEDSQPFVRRSALGALREVRSALVDERAEFLAEDWFQGIRGDLSGCIQELALENRIPVLIRELRDRQEDGGEFVALRKTVIALHKLTGQHHGFPADYFKMIRYDWKRERAIMKEWWEKPAAEREKAIAQWEKEFGTYDRRPVLLAQLRHADPGNIARAVRELHALTPEAPTPGFTKATAEAARENLVPDAAPFVALVEEAKAFQAMPEAERMNILDAWEKAGR